MPSHFFCKLVPARPSFAQDMTPQERDIMGRHVGYWKTLMQHGKVVVFGPVMDPAANYGIGILAVEDEAEARDLTNRDPATEIMHYDIFPMRAILPG